jgi:acyl-CoA thioesterase
VPNIGGLNRGWLGGLDIRQVEGGMAYWMRLLDRPLTRAALGFMADVVPSGVVRAAGRAGAGRSLDNSIRFGPDPVGDWLLVDIDPHQISGGYVNGAARLWARDGTLLGIASQTASLLLFD